MRPVLPIQSSIMILKFIQKSRHKFYCVLQLHDFICLSHFATKLLRTVHKDFDSSAVKWRMASTGKLCPRTDMTKLSIVFQTLTYEVKSTRGNKWDIQIFNIASFSFYNGSCKQLPVRFASVRGERSAFDWKCTSVQSDSKN